MFLTGLLCGQDLSPFSVCPALAVSFVAPPSARLCLASSFLLHYVPLRCHFRLPSDATFKIAAQLCRRVLLSMLLSSMFSYAPAHSGNAHPSSFISVLNGRKGRFTPSKSQSATNTCRANCLYRSTHNQGGRSDGQLATRLGLGYLQCQTSILRKKRCRQC